MAPPPDGLYNVDIGVGSGDFGHLLTFHDLNSDKYSDMITLGDSLKSLVIYAYDSMELTFKLWKTINVDGCQEIYNVAVGRSTT